MPQPPAPALIDPSHLDAQSRHAGHAYRLQSRHAARPFALRGQVQTHAMPAGATLHLVNVRDEQAQQVQMQLKPGIRMAWVLHGRADVSYGPRHFTLGPAAHAPRPRPLAANVVALAEADQFTRRARAGEREATVSLCLTPEWLDSLGAAAPSSDALRSAQAFAKQHLRHGQCPVPPALQPLLGSLLAPPVLEPALHALYLESAFQLLACHAVQSMHELATRTHNAPPASPPRLTGARRRQMAQVRELLDSGAADRWSLHAIAREHHMSAATLQRHFQQVHGQSVFEYQRQRRLQLALHSLQQGEADIAQAAALAGYRHTANFSTAFRKAFGISPRQALRHIPPGSR
ncbi:AraC family transcriptional regulator [Comamonadaceae bacterium OH2545_COT-014]|nr:AraC family transcriptional regulator [Comamonadaceae bacterium OH2545_COT-014]